MSQVTECTDREVWDELVLDSGGNPLQLWGWGQLKSSHNWSVQRLIVSEDETEIGGGQLLKRTLPMPFNSLLYLPRGPFAVPGKEREVLHALTDYAKRHHKSVVLQSEPDWEEFPEVKGWRQSPNTILIPRTLVLDLDKSSDDLLAAMSKKTRQYIRKSSKEPLEIRRVRDRAEIGKCLEIYKQTAARAGFALHDDKYYYDAHEAMGEGSVIFASYQGDSPVAFVWLTVSSQTAFELWGGMNDEGQRLRANYALKWHAITKCQEWGVAKYDMNGLLNDGVSTFKQGFARHENMLAGTYDYPLSPLYTAWTHALPTARRIIRKLKK